MTDTVSIPRKDLKHLLEMHADATHLLDETVDFIDHGKTAAASQHIGAELEARITRMQEIEERCPEVRTILDELHNQELNQNPDIGDVEKQVFGDDLQ